MQICQNTDYALGYNNILIMPSELSEIEHRDECKPYRNDDEYLPIFTAPMSTIVDEKNFKLFEENKIHSIMPRNVEFTTRMEHMLNGNWTALSLKEFEDIFCQDNISLTSDIQVKVLIDVANGNMSKIYKLVRKAKCNVEKGKLVIMVGNIANPMTYVHCVKSGVDFVRCGVGTGSVCETTKVTSIGYPPATLISEIKALKEKMSAELSIPIDEMPKIIADGGISTIGTIAKALALGADYVMLGRMLAATVESAAPLLTIEENKNIVEVEDISKVNLSSNKYYKKFYGMASKQGKLDIGSNLNRIEGTEALITVNYTIDDFVKQFITSIQSTMSYCNCKFIEQIYNKANIIKLA